MKPEDYALDDLHQAALAEFESDEDARRVLNAAYQAALKNHIALLEMLELLRTKTKGSAA